MRQPFIETDTFVQSFTVGETIHFPPAVCRP